MRTRTCMSVSLHAELTRAVSHLEPEAAQHRPAALRASLPARRSAAWAGLGRSVPGCPPALCRLRSLRCAVAPPAGRRRAAPGGWGLPGRPRERARGLRGTASWLRPPRSEGPLPSDLQLWGAPGSANSALLFSPPPRSWLYLFMRLIKAVSGLMCPRRLPPLAAASLLRWDSPGKRLLVVKCHHLLMSRELSEERLAVFNVGSAGSASLSEAGHPHSVPRVGTEPPPPGG